MKDREAGGEIGNMAAQDKQEHAIAIALLKRDVERNTEDIDELKDRFEVLDDRMNTLTNKQDVSNTLLRQLVEWKEREREADVLGFIERNKTLILVALVAWVLLSGGAGAAQILKMVLE